MMSHHILISETLRSRLFYFDTFIVEETESRQADMTQAASSTRSRGAPLRGYSTKEMKSTTAQTDRDAPTAAWEKNPLALMAASEVECHIQGALLQMFKLWSALGETHNWAIWAALTVFTVKLTCCICLSPTASCWLLSYISPFISCSYPPRPSIAALIEAFKTN